MKKINVTVICPGEEEYPGCEDLLRSYPEINLVASFRALDAAGFGTALDGTDVLLLDEALVHREGPEKVRAIHVDYPNIKTLQITENLREINPMTAVSLGLRGVMERASMVSMLRKAITVLYSGEAWMSRGMVQSLHHHSRQSKYSSLWLAADVHLPSGGKLN